jgi:NADP-dependent 3-hydroxy acid dehydrogenase YdfG
MGFGSFLKKFAADVINVAGVVSGIGPIFAKALPAAAGQAVTTGINDFEQVATIVQTIEVGAESLQPGMTDAQKVAAMTPSVAQVVLQSSILAGKKIANQALFTQGCQELSQGMQDIMNSIDESAATVTKVTS